MRVIIATGIYPPEVGGPATSSKLLKEKLEAEAIGVQVVVFGLSRKFPKVIRHIHYTLRLLRAVGLRKTIIFSQDIISVGFPAAVVSFMPNVSLVARVPGDYAWEQSTQKFGVTETLDDFQDKGYGLKIETLRKVQRWVLRRAHTVIVPSNYFKSIVIKWGINQQTLVVVYNGIDCKLEFKNKVQTNTRLPLKIVTAGRLVPWKGFDTLIEIFQSIPEAQLLIYGEGPDRQRLEDIIENKKLETKVLLKGGVDRDFLMEEISNASGFVLNTRFESFSYQIAEVMQIGTPIITTNVGSLPELISNGKEGVLLNPDDFEGFAREIATLSDRSVWGERVLNAREKVQVFSIERTISNYIKIFKSI
tara:strand:- start:3949 stop:5034 length:1086 start_codon:yes stop_codon:yes gene_type:complete